MRFRRYFFLGAVLATAAALAVTMPWARAEIAAQGHAQMFVIDDDGDRHEHVWEFGGDHGWLGVSLSRDQDTEGARVDRVIDDSPAARAGLREGDLIVSIDGEAVRSPSDVSHRIRSLDSGDTVDLEIVRGGSRQNVRSELGEMPNVFSWSGEAHDAPFEFHLDKGEFAEHMKELHERLADMDLDIHMPDIDMDVTGFAFSFGDFRRPLLGVQPVETTPELREHLGGQRDAGVLVGKVLEGMPAEAAGVLVGDLILSVDGEKVGSSGDLVRALRHREGGTVRLEVVRDGRTLTLEAVLPPPDDEEKDRHFGPAPVRRPPAAPAGTQKA